MVHHPDIPVFGQTLESVESRFEDSQSQVYFAGAPLAGRDGWN